MSFGWFKDNDIMWFTILIVSSMIKHAADYSVISCSRQWQSNSVRSGVMLADDIISDTGRHFMPFESSTPNDSQYEYDGNDIVESGDDSDCHQKQEQEEADIITKTVSSHASLDTGTNGIDKCPLFMITFIVAFVMCGYTCHTIILDQFLYKVFATDVLGNSSQDTARHPCGNRSSNNSDLDKEVEQIQSKTSYLYLLLSVTCNGLAILTNVLFGVYSYAIHRRVQILIPAIGLTVRCTCLLIVAFFHLDVHWLFLGFVCDGLGGSLSGFFLASFLYSSDITPRNGKRTFGIAIIEGVKGILGGSVKVMAGFLLDKNDFVLSSAAVVGFFLLAMLIMCCLPNHKPSMNTHATSFKNASLIMLSPFNTNVKEVKRIVWLSCFSFFAFMVIVVGIDKILPLYLMDFPFCWSALMITWLSFGRDLSYNCFTVFGIPIFYRCLPGLSLAVIGLVLLAAYHALYALATTTLQAFMGPILSIGMGLPITLIRGETSKLLEPDVQGPLFACFAVLESISFFLGPLIFLNMYRLSLNTYRGLPFFVACALMVFPIFSMIIHQKILMGYTKMQKYTLLSVQVPDNKNKER